MADTFRTFIPPLPAVPASGDLRSRLQGVLRVLAGQINDEKYAAVVPAVLDSATRDPELAEFREVFTRSQRAPLDTVLRASTAAGELPADLDRDGAIAASVGPLLFRRVVLSRNPSMPLTPTSSSTHSYKPTFNDVLHQRTLNSAGRAAAPRRRARNARRGENWSGPCRSVVAK